MSQTERAGAGLRRARKSDCRRLAELAAIAGEGIPEYLWSQMAQPHEPPVDVGTARIAPEEADFSYRNALVAEHRGEVVAMVLAYPLPPADEMTPSGDYPEVLHPVIELERTVPGSFYVNMLATLPGFRGAGLGSLLLDAVAARATATGCGKLSVAVFEQNTGALRLYRRHGFREAARRPVIAHPCHPYDGDVLMLTRALKARPAAG